MKVLLLGATGRTGKLILGQLIAQGYAVNAIVRDKTKVEISAAGLTVMQGSTLDEALLKLAIQGCDAVISALNVARNNDFPWSALRTPERLMSETMEKVIRVANKAGVKRVIVLSAWGVNETLNDIPWWFKFTIQHSNIKYGYLDHERQEKLLAQSNLNWTAIRPVGLINSKADKKVRVFLDNKTKPSLMISRKSVADFTVQVLKEETYIGSAPAISW